MCVFSDLKRQERGGVRVAQRGLLFLILHLVLWQRSVFEVLREHGVLSLNRCMLINLEIGSRINYIATYSITLTCKREQDG